ncbi:MAG: penicillin-binding protein [Nocardiopsaceae bacterium]|nr:penicillin-binding protein [Nocardiopsaceae bacterium]
MHPRLRHADPKTIGLLAALALAAGTLTAVAALPVVGAAGIAVKNAAQTFNDLPVKGLGQVPTRSEILDSSGKVIASYYPRGIYRDPVKWHKIAPVMRNAIIAIEDYRFWKHGAFDLHGTLRAIYSTVSGNQVQGGSDLAQQYVKNACILTAKTKAAAQQCTAFSPARKITELRIAANVARRMSKPQLLTAYLNVAYFDNQAYGIKVASEVYFSVPPSELTLTQAALLAGIVESPTRYDPFANPQNALQRRAQVLHAMAEHGYISWATERRAVKAPLGLHRSNVPLQTGCAGAKIKNAAFFCDYVMSVMKVNPAYKEAYHRMQTVGGLKIHTTLSPQDQRAATNAVNYVVPARKPYYNPGYNVNTEVMIQPGTGYVKAIAVDRPFGYGPGETAVNYAVDSKFNGGAGVQTGSSSKIFTLVAALKKGIPFGYSLDVHDNMTVGGFTDCHGNYVAPFTVQNADGNEGGKIPLYFGTTMSINAFYVDLESKVGLCSVVRTAASMGLHRADGTSLLRTIGKYGQAGYEPAADGLASFTLGSVNVSPMSMAAAYATVASRGVYCRPIAIKRITDLHGHNLPVQGAACHRVMSTGVADAANYVLRGVLENGTAGGRNTLGREAAAKTGTANQGYYAAFAGYTPTLAGYVSVFNPLNPTTTGAMLGYRSTYRAYPGGYPNSPGQMFGDDAPGATWQYSFERANLGRPLDFIHPPGFYFSMGTGSAPISPPKKKKPGGGGNGGGGGPGPGGGGGGNGGH